MEGREKTCTRCHQSKPLRAFNRKARNRDGLDNQCKTCRKEARVLRRAAEINAQARFARAGSRRAGPWLGVRAIFVMYNAAFDRCGELAWQDVAGPFRKPWARWGTIVGMDEHGNVWLQLDAPIEDSNHSLDDVILAAAYRVFVLAGTFERVVGQAAGKAVAA